MHRIDDPYWEDVSRDYTLEIHEDIAGDWVNFSLGRATVGEWTTGSFHDMDGDDSYEMELCGGRRYRMLVFHYTEPAHDGQFYVPTINLKRHRIIGTGISWDSHFVQTMTIDKPAGTGLKTVVVEISRRPADPYVVPGEIFRMGEGRYRFLVEPVDFSEAPCAPASNAPVNNPATGSPTISGTVRVGKTLFAIISGIADADGIRRAAFAYQWLADGVAISGATGSRYTPTDADVGKALKVRVSFTDDAGNEESLTSAATEAVAERSGLQVRTATVDGAALALAFNATLDLSGDGLPPCRPSR